MSVIEMRMLRWISGKKMKNRMRWELILGANRM